MADEDLGLPKAKVTQIIKEMMPNGTRTSPEARELMMDCCVEFIHLISSEANELCDKQQKKTLTGDHVMQALQSLGFGDYNHEVKKEQQLYKENAKAGMYKMGKQDSEMSIEDMLEEQRKMFAKAKERHQTS